MQRRWDMHTNQDIPMVFAFFFLPLEVKKGWNVLIGTRIGVHAHSHPCTHTHTHTTRVQVLLSIQGMILISDPMFNEPGYEAIRGTQEGIVSKYPSPDFDQN